MTVESSLQEDVGKVDEFHSSDIHWGEEKEIDEHQCL